MKTKTLKLAGLLITIFMIIATLGVFSITASAADGLTTTIIDGTEYYQISDADDLYEFARIVNGTHETIEKNRSANAILVADIVVNDSLESKITVADDGSATVNENATIREWIPIGAGQSTPFCGIFDGNGKTVSGLYFNDGEADYVGLIGYALTATVKNVGVTESYINGGKRVGAIVGVSSEDGSVSDCYNGGTVRGTFATGGVIGFSAQGDTVNNCYNIGTVIGDSDVGGVAGVSYAYNSGCYNTGTVKGTEWVGGIIGSTDKSTLVTNCYNMGSVSGTERIGGIVGCSGSTVTLSYNEGPISASSDYAGGIVGYNIGTVAYCYNISTVSGLSGVGGISGYNYGPVTSCFNVGEVSASDYVGGIAGKDSAEPYVVNSCYLIGAAKDTTGKSQAGIGYHSTGYSNTDIEGCTTGIADFSTGESAHILQSGVEAVEGVVPQIWGQDIDNGKTVQALPAFSGAAVYRYEICGEVNFSNTEYESVYHSFTNGFCIHCDCYESPIGSGTKDDPYKIANAGQLYWFAAVVNGDTEATRGIAQNKKAYAELTANIIINENLFSKITIDQDGNATLNDGATVRTWTPIGKDESNRYNATFNGAEKTISGLYFNDSSASYVGLFGYLDHSGTDSKIQNVGLEESYVFGNEYVGGIVAYPGSTVDSCYNNSIVKGSKYVGGVSGYNYGTIENSYNSGRIYGGANAGGIVGYCSTSASITASYNTGTVSGTTNVGGVAGDVRGRDGTFIENCYNTGAISGTEYVGGVIGYAYAVVNGCYNEGTVSGTKYVGGIVGDNSYILTNCYNKGAVSGGERIGGIAGNSSGSVTLCYNVQSISGTGYVGGVVGYNVSEVTDCYNTKNISGDSCVGGIVGYNVGTVTSCFNVGAVKGTSKFVGGIAGVNHKTMTNCYYLTDCAKDGTDTVQFGAGNIRSGETTADIAGSSAGYSDFTTGEVAYLLNGDQSSITWGQKLTTDGDPYPVLDSTKIVYKLSPCTVYSNTEGTKAHTDSSYSASGATITNLCSSCGTVFGSATVIIAVDTTYTGLANSWASVTYSESWAGNKNLLITYKQGETVLDTPPINAGTYTASITFEGVTASLSFTIEKAEFDFETPTGLTAIYGQTLADVALTTGFSWQNALTTPVGNVGNNSFKVTYTPTDADNYKTTENIDVIIFVGKANAAVANAPTPNSLTYNGVAQSLVYAGEANGGEMVYSLSENGEFTPTSPTGTNAAEYTVYYKVKGDGNHNDTAVNSVKVTIAPKNITGGTVTVNGTFTYDGSAKTPADISVTVDGLTLTVDDCDISYSNNVNAGGATLTVTGKGNYIGTATGQFIILKASAPAIVWPTASGLTYGQKLSESTLTSTDTNGTFAWQNGDTVPSVTNSGYVVVYTPNDTDNYDYIGVELTKTITVIVSKKAVTITADSLTVCVGITPYNLLTYKIEGLVGGDSISKAPTVNTDVDVNTPGDYAITVSGAEASDNYEIAYAGGTLTVLEHEYGDWQKHSADQHKKACECGAAVFTGHSWNEGEITKEPTCTEQGEKIFVCTDCGEIFIGELLVAENAHKWNDGEVTTEPTCTEKGVKTYTCTHNGEHTYTEDVNTLGHKYDNACDATCNTCGEERSPADHVDADEDHTCDECGASLLKDGLSGGAIAGIAVGSTATLGLGGFSLFWFVIKKKKWSDLVGIFKK